MLATLFSTPYRGRRLFHGMRRQAVALADISLEALDDRALSAHADEFFATLLDETPLRACTRWSPHSLVPTCSWRPSSTAWVPTDADAVLKRLMTGLGTLPNVRMTYRLMISPRSRARRARPAFTSPVT